MCNLEDFSNLRLTDYHAQILRDELDMWHRYYLPIKGTVLDVGAGCGETAFFYLNHGAQRVICIESDETALECLHHNFDDNSRVVIVSAHLDGIKVDIEGSELGAIIETHFPTRVRALKILRDR